MAMSNATHTKLFDLYCNGTVIVRMRSMGVCCSVMARNKRLLMYKNCKFEIKYNSTTI